MRTYGTRINYSKIPEKEWLKYPDNKPKQRGYYLTTYLSLNDGVLYYKCLYWNSNNQHWIWNRPIEVGCFVEKSRTDFYCPCLEKVEELIDEWTLIERQGETNMNLCKDCEYYHKLTQAKSSSTVMPLVTEMHHCRHPNLEQTDLVTGEKIRTLVDCYRIRDNENFCGKKGNWFKQNVKEN